MYYKIKVLGTNKVFEISANNQQQALDFFVENYVVINKSVKSRNFMLQKCVEEISQLEHSELFNLLSEYDRYVIEITNREDGSIPACVAEFYENEYQLIQEGEIESYLK